MPYLYKSRKSWSIGVALVAAFLLAGCEPTAPVEPCVVEQNLGDTIIVVGC